MQRNGPPRGSGQSCSSSTELDFGPYAARRAMSIKRSSTDRGTSTPSAVRGDAKNRAASAQSKRRTAASASLQLLLWESSHAAVRERAVCMWVDRPRGDGREQPEQRRRGAGDGGVRPLPPRRHAEMPPGLRERHLHRPAPDEPARALSRLRAEVGARGAWGAERAGGIPHQHPAVHQHGRQAGVMPDCGAGSGLHRAPERSEGRGLRVLGHCGASRFG